MGLASVSVHVRLSAEKGVRLGMPLSPLLSSLLVLLLLVFVFVFVLVLLLLLLLVLLSASVSV